MKNELIPSFNKLFTRELETSINSIMPKLTEAFIKVYGEDNRLYIINVLNTLQTIYFISENYLRLALQDKNISKLNKQIIRMYLEHLRYLNRAYKNISENDEARFIIDNYTTKYPFSYETINYFYEPLGDDFPAYQTFINELEATRPIYKTILLPIFSIDLKTIIHEINHALLLELMADSPKSFIIPTMFLSITSEELNNDYLANIVLKEYIKLGGIIPKPLLRFNIKNPYQKGYYILKYLYSKLGPLLIISLITRNHNLFYELTGFANMQELCELIDSLFIEYDAQKYVKLIKLINKMAISAQKNSKTDYESFYQELESMGYKVRKL